MYKNFFKRFFDVLISAAGLLLLSPVFLLVTLLLYFANQGKPFFFQQRPGKNEKIFKLVKFKTMNDKKDVHGNLLPDVQRMTKTGTFLRKYSIDELPQLLNVLNGSMSLIGPRPLLIAYLKYYNEQQKKRHLVKPGITGWAQVNGRNAISWEQKFDYDVYYVENISFKLDIKIFFLTIKKVFAKEGVNSSTTETMPFFTGTEKKGTVSL